MKRYHLALIICGFLLSMQSAIAGGVRENTDVVLNTHERKFTIRYDNGRTDQLVIVYQGHLKSYMRQDGNAHWPDNRSCTYSVKGYITRKAYFVLGTGDRAEFGPLSNVYDKDAAGGGGKDFFENLAGSSAPCNNYVNAMNSAKQSIQIAVNEAQLKLITQKITIDELRNAQTGSSAMALSIVEH